MNDMTQRNSEDGQLLEKRAELPFFSYSAQERVSKAKTYLFIFAILVMTVLLMIGVASAVRLNEVTVDISEIKAEITALQKQNNELESELEKKNDMVAFEQYAMNELGMLKGDETQSDDREDKIE